VSNGRPVGGIGVMMRADTGLMLVLLL